MKAYRCLFLDTSGNVSGSDELVAADDTAVIAKARTVKRWRGAVAAHRSLITQAALTGRITRNCHAAYGSIVGSAAVEHGRAD